MKKTLTLIVVACSLLFGEYCSICDGVPQKEETIHEKCEACGKTITDTMELGQVRFAKGGLGICEGIYVGFSINPNMKTRIVCQTCLDEWVALVRPSNMFVEKTFNLFVQQKRESSKQKGAIIINGKKVRARSQEELVEIGELLLNFSRGVSQSRHLSMSDYLGYPRSSYGS